MNDHLDYNDLLHRAARQLSGLMEDRETVDDMREKLTHQINGLRDIVFALSGLLDVNPHTAYPELFPELFEPETGFTDAVREVLKTSDKYLSPVDIRDELKRRLFNLDKYKNPLAAIHQTLKRLVDGAEIERHPDEEKKLYKWKSPQGFKPLTQSASGKGLLAPPPAPNVFRQSALKNLAGQEVKKGGLKELAERMSKEKGKKE